MEGSVKTFVMALGLAAVVAVPALAQTGTDRTATQRSMNAGQEQSILNNVNQSYGTDFVVAESGNTSWQFEPSRRRYPDGN